MAKKVSGKKKDLEVKAQKKTIKDESVVLQKQPEEKVGTKQNAIVIIFIIALLLIAGEITTIALKQNKMNKKPVLDTTWNPQYSGQIGMPVSGNSLYVIDNNMNQVKKYDKMAGTLLSVYSFNFTPKWAQEDSKGNSYVFLTGLNKIVKMDIKGKFTVFINDAHPDSPNFVIDSDDNFFVSDGVSDKIIKYSSGGDKILEFGGKGDEKDKFYRLGRIFIDKKNNIYAIETASPYKIKVFDDNGKFIKKMKLGLKTLSGLEALAITNDGNIYVNDVSEGNIKVFNNDGGLLGKFDSDSALRYKIGLPGAFSGGVDNHIYVGSNNLAVFEPINY